MKRCLFLVFLVLILTGCGSDDRNLEQIMTIRQQLNARDGCAFDAYITADYGDKLYTFTLQCQTDKYGNIKFSVIQPQAIAGISGIIDEEKGALTFNDQNLAFSLMADGQLTPVSAPWLMIKSLRGGYVRACDKHDGLLYAEIDDSYQEDTIQLNFWFDENDHPQYVDFLWQGRRIIAMEVKNFCYL